MVQVRIDHLYFSYGSDNVLKNVNLVTTSGKLLFLLGPNGTGKSTLLKCIAGIIVPQRGKILLDGRDLKGIGPRELSKLVGYVPQSMKPVFSMTVYEAILTARLPYIHWNPSKVDLEKTEDVIRTLKLERLAFRYTNELSGGEWQMVLLGMALVKESPLLLLDEPTNNLDLKHQVEVMKLISRLAKDEEKTIIVTSHDINIASRYADLIAIMKNGCIYAIGEPFSILNEKIIKEVYDVEVEIIKCNSLLINPI